MTIDQARQITDDALARLTAALEAGHSDTLKSYLAMMARFHHYSWGNVMLIQSQMPGATHVAGFNAWLKLKRFVRKGQKGIVILAPLVGKPKTDTPEADHTRLFGFRATHVFDVSQTDGEPLSEFAEVQGDPAEQVDRLTEFVSARGITLEYSAAIAPAKGVSMGGKIILQPGLPAAEHFSVLVHELAHELLHRDERRASTDTRIRETEAEAVAFVVNTAIGLDCGTANADYIQLHRGDAKLLAESLCYVQRVASELIGAIKEDVRHTPATGETYASLAS